MAASNTVRLHVSPLNPPLLDAILGGEPASQMSYHTVPTFPENSYGYIEVSAARAHKIMTKLNGAILKGRKLHIQKARPQTRPQPDNGATDGADDASEKPTIKKRKVTDNVVDGFELPDGRQVKRGWAQPPEDHRSRKAKVHDARKSQQRSKYTEKPECLFQTKLPPNRAGALPEKKTASKKKHKKPRDSVVVHEFEKSTAFPTFIRTEGPKSSRASEFVEGKGWIDQDGNVKEGPPVLKRPVDAGIGKRKRMSTEIPRRTEIQGQGQKDSGPKGTEDQSHDKKDQEGDDEGQKEGDDMDESDDSEDQGQKQAQHDNQDEDDESEGEGLEDVQDKDQDKDEDKIPKKAKDHPQLNEDYTSSDLSSSVSDESSADDTKTQTKTRQTSSKHTAKTSESSAEPLPQSQPLVQQDQQPSSEPEIHPLEALFKLPLQPQTPSKNTTDAADTTFSFFGGGNDDDIEEEPGAETQIDQPTANIETEPQTPFTKLDSQARGVRSAAPTPDTAAVGSRFRDVAATGTGNREDDKEDEESENEIREESEFAKWFYQNRGDNNRMWKRRRREAAKEHRQHLNRQRGTKGKY